MIKITKKPTDENGDIIFSEKSLDRGADDFIRQAKRAGVTDLDVICDNISKEIDKLERKEISRTNLKYYLASLGAAGELLWNYINENNLSLDLGTLLMGIGGYTLGNMMYRLIKNKRNYMQKVLAVLNERNGENQLNKDKQSRGSSFEQRLRAAIKAKE